MNLKGNSDIQKENNCEDGSEINDKPLNWYNNRCKNLKFTYEGWDDSTYFCELCGIYFKIYEDDMK